MRAVRFRLIWPRVLSIGGGLLLAAGCVQGPDGEIVNALDVCVDSSDGALCDDRQPCTIDDACLNQVCTGTPVANGRPCTDGNVCTGPDQCQAGICVGAMLADGTACTDDNACTDLDVCRQGACQPGAPRICDDGDSCTIDTCVSPGGCVFSPRECALPPDAAADRSIESRPDLPPDLPPDLRVDLALPDGPDAISEGGPPDGPELDTGVLDTGSDVGVLDAGGDAAPPDGGADTSPDAGADAQTDANPDTPDAAEAGRDGGGVDLSDTPPDLRVRGGGCACGLAAAPTPTWSLVVALGVALVLARRRGRGPTEH